jgi:hypothetical protein
MKQKQRAVGSKTTMIKSRVYNQAARYFNPKDEMYNKALVQFTTVGADVEKQYDRLSDADKKKLFMEIAEQMTGIRAIVRSGYYELRSYKEKRKAKAERDREKEENKQYRIEHGLPLSARDRKQKPTEWKEKQKKAS